MNIHTADIVDKNMTQVDDIQSFIAAQKKRIEEERAGLSKPTFSPRNVSETRTGKTRFYDLKFNDFKILIERKQRFCLFKCISRLLRGIMEMIIKHHKTITLSK